MAKKKKRILYPVLFMMLITSLFTLALAILNEITIDKIIYNEDMKVKRTLLYVFDIKLDSDANEAVDKVYTEMIEKIDINNRDVYVAKKNDEIIGYAFPVNGNALWGSVEGYAAITPDFKRLIGVDFLSHSETPGLGGRISDLEYKDQFRYLNLDSSHYNYIIYRPHPEGNIDAIAGATLTSDSVRKFLNEDIHQFILDMGREK